MYFYTTQHVNCGLEATKVYKSSKSENISIPLP